MQKSKLQFKIQKLLSALTVLAIGLFMPLAASAARLSLSPGTITVSRGQNVTMTVTVNPQGSTIYSTKAELQYPAELLEFISFNFGSGWTHASPDDFNSGGVLRRTAGYPNPGLSSQAIFGTVTFLAKAAGTGTVSITADSVVYDGSLQNVLTGVPVSASVAIRAPAVPVSTPLTGTVTTPTPTAPSPTPEVEVALESESEQGFNLFAAIGNLISLGTGNAFAGALTVVVIFAAAWFGYRKIRRKKE